MLSFCDRQTQYLITGCYHCIQGANSAIIIYYSLDTGESICMSVAGTSVNIEPNNLSSIQVSKYLFCTGMCISHGTLYCQGGAIIQRKGTHYSKIIP